MIKIPRPIFRETEIVICEMCGKHIYIKDSYVDGKKQVLCRDCYQDIYGDEERFHFGEGVIKMVDVKIKLLEGGIMPTKAHDGDAAWDCYARENAIIDYTSHRSETEVPVKMIGLGFCLELPKGYHAEIVPRSSIGLKTNLRMPNSVGIIDSNYRGEVKAMYELAGISYAGWEGGGITLPHTIHKGDRICQMLIVKDPEVRLVQVDELSDSERGAGGFGSTGV